jgi:hypothetical protein
MRGVVESIESPQVLPETGLGVRRVDDPTSLAVRKEPGRQGREPERQRKNLRI